MPDRDKNMGPLKRNGLLGVLSILLTASLLLVLSAGTPQASEAEDLATIREAAEQGAASSQYTLGVKYGNGNGVPQNDVAAYAWFSLAAAQGNENAAEHKYIIAKRFTPAQQDEAQSLVAELQAKIDKQLNLPASSPPVFANETALRSWIQSIKPAAGGK